MTTTLSMIRVLWPSLPDHIVGALAVACDQLGLHPGCDLTTVRHMHSGEKLLVLSSKGMQKYLEGKGEAICHQDDREHLPGTVRISMTDRNTYVRWTVVMTGTQPGGCYEDGWFSAWNFVQENEGVPIMINMQNCRVIRLPSAQQRIVRAKASVPVRKESPAYRKRVLDEVRSMSLCCATTKPKGELRKPNRVMVDEAIDQDHESQMLEEAMWNSGLLSTECDVRWAKMCFVNALFEEVGVGAVSLEAPVVLRMAASLLIRIRTFSGSSPVIAIGDSTPLRKFIRQGLAKIAELMSVARQGFLPPTPCVPNFAALEKNEQKGKILLGFKMQTSASSQLELRAKQPTDEQERGLIATQISLKVFVGGGPRTTVVDRDRLPVCCMAPRDGSYERIVYGIDRWDQIAGWSRTRYNARNEWNGNSVSNEINDSRSLDLEVWSAVHVPMASLVTERYRSQMPALYEQRTP